VTDDAPAIWPASADLCAAVTQRVNAVLNEQGNRLAPMIRLILSREDRVLSPEPRPQSSVLVAFACVSAGAAWQRALWSAVAMECAMAAADVFDDIADDEASALGEPGVVLMGAAGLLALAAGSLLRGTDDGLSQRTVIDLGRMLSDELAHAADGQASSVAPDASDDALGAYELAAAKSGPLGSLAARLGARCATDDAEVQELYATYGWHLAVYSQLLNDTRDAAPGGPTHKRDVRDGRQTVPLVFTGSSGAPADVRGAALSSWESHERNRVAAEGGLVAALALAQAERLRALSALDTLASSGRPVEGLRRLLS